MEWTLKNFLTSDYKWEYFIKWLLKQDFKKYSNVIEQIDTFVEDNWLCMNWEYYINDENASKILNLLKNNA